MAPKTRDRILDLSLAMFNERGEPNVTTNHIADELEISPGNLYYHFRNKDDIVEHLFARYEARMDQVLISPEDRLPTLEDIWLQLHMAFECMWEVPVHPARPGRPHQPQPQAAPALRPHHQARAAERERGARGPQPRRGDARLAPGDRGDLHQHPPGRDVSG
jgi:AcrR family transcriptional regulator